MIGERETVAKLFDFVDPETVESDGNMKEFDLS